ncbi:MAG: hypothetical protein QMD71_02630 [bacterium]|nr:hypothetical protein [bacterium]
MRYKFLLAFVFFATVTWARLDHFTFTPIDSIQTAGIPFSIHVEARDSLDQLYTQFDNVFTDLLLRLPYSISYSPYSPSRLYFLRGICDTNVSIYISDSAQLWIRDPWGVNITGESNWFFVKKSNYKRLQLLLDCEEPSPGDLANRGRHYVQTPEATAGEPYKLIGRSTDLYWNSIDSSITDSFSISSTDSFAVLPHDTFLTAGICSLTVYLRTATEIKLFVSNLSDTSILGDTSPPLRVNPGQYNRLLLIAPGEQSCPGEIGNGKSGAPAILCSGLWYTFKVYGTDTCWNKVHNAVDTVRLVEYLSAPPDSMNPVTLPLTDGEASFKVLYNRYGKKGLQAIGTAVPLSAPVYFDVGIGKYRIIVPDTIKASIPFSITVRFVDTDGNIIPNDSKFYLKAVKAYKIDSLAKGALSPPNELLTAGTCYINNASYSSPVDDTIRIAIWDSLALDTVFFSYSNPILVWHGPSEEDLIIADPNPFGPPEYPPPTIIKFYPMGGEIIAKIYDPFANLVRSFSENEIDKSDPHCYKIKWDGRNDRGMRVANGVYQLCIIITQEAQPVAVWREKITVVW